MISWQRRAQGERGLALYRIDAEADGFGAPGGFDPLDALLARFPTPSARHVRERFAARVPPVSGGFRVACHVISLPDALLIVDSTFRTTAPEVFPGALEAIVAAEGRRLSDRPLHVIYTHAHFDHAGGHAAVTALGEGVSIWCHPYTPQIHAAVVARRGISASRGHFFRDLGITSGEQALSAAVTEARRGSGGDGPEPGAEPPLRHDLPLDPGGGRAALADGRVEVLRFDGHIPGHLCVLVDRAHLITGDMWLPATTSTITPARVAELAGVPAEECGVDRYIASSERLLGLDVDDCMSYPSHEHVFRNPKRMALRDLELFAERMARVYDVLDEHRARPMRVVDLAWGGADTQPIWNLRDSKYRLMAAHDEACAYVEDLVACGDLREVEPERYLYDGGRTLSGRLDAALARARARYGHLEFRSRARGVAAR